MSGKTVVRLFLFNSVQKSAHQSWRADKASVRFFQWDLVCDRKSLSKMTATVFFLGVMLGAIAFGYLSDKYVVSVVMERLT